MTKKMSLDKIDLPMTANVKDIFGPWVKLKDDPSRYGLVDDWRGDGPYTVFFGELGTVIDPLIMGEEHDADNLVLVTQEKYERWETKHPWEDKRADPPLDS